MTDMQLHDATLTCRECGQKFTFTAGEQLSYARRGQGAPGHCAFCRAARMIASGVHSTSSSGESRNRGEPALYLAVCDQCGKQTKVPFEPHGNRPVYCSDCYRGQRASSRGGYDSGRSRTSGYSRR